MSNRRQSLQLLAPAALPASFVNQNPKFAKHSWSSFDLDRLIFLEGKVAQVKWQNRHVEMNH
jgi:hypothetical protein